MFDENELNRLYERLIKRINNILSISKVLEYYFEPGKEIKYILYRPVTGRQVSDKIISIVDFRTFFYTYKLFHILSQGYIINDVWVNLDEFKNKIRRPVLSITTLNIENLYNKIYNIMKWKKEVNISIDSYDEDSGTYVEIYHDMCVDVYYELLLHEYHENIEYKVGRWIFPSNVFELSFLNKTTKDKIVRYYIDYRKNRYDVKISRNIDNYIDLFNMLSQLSIYILDLIILAYYEVLYYIT